MLLDWIGAKRPRGHNVHRLGDCQIHVQYSCNWKVPEERKEIWIASLNIRSGGWGGLEAALRALHQGKLDVGVLQETKLTQGVHMHYGAGYYIWATHAESIHWG